MSCKAIQAPSIQLHLLVLQIAATQHYNIICGVQRISKMGLAQILLAYIEAFLGWLLHSFRGRDAKLFTRSAAFKNVPQTIKVTSGLGASGRTVFPIQYTAVSPAFCNCHAYLACYCYPDGIVMHEWQCVPSVCIGHMQPH